MDLSRRRLKRRKVDYRHLAGLSEVDDFAAEEVSTKRSNDNACTICAAVSPDDLFNGHATKIANGRLVFDFLVSVSSQFSELSLQDTGDFPICASCLSLADDIAKLTDQLESAKEQFNETLRKSTESDSLLTFKSVRYDVVDEENINSQQLMPAPAVADLKAFLQSPILRLTESELSLLGINRDSDDDVTLSVAELNAIGAKYNLTPDGRLLIVSIPSQSGSQALSTSTMLQCAVCEANCSSISSLHAHLLNRLCHSDQKEDLKFTSRRSALRLNTLGHKDKVECDICGRLLASKERLEAHRKQHRGERPFICQTCGKRFTRKASMLEHCARHKGLRDRECTICSKKFYSTSYWRHMSTVHAQVEKMVHRCTICDRKFAQKYRLTNHEKSHINYFCREFVCNKCPDEKRFATLNRYRTHEKQVHEGEKTYGSKLCSDCGIIFHSASSLIAHRKRQHTGAERTQFSAEADYQMHLEQDHSGNNAYSCSWCGLQFSSYVELDSHAQGCQQSVIPSAEIVGHEEIVQPDFDDGSTILQIQSVDETAHMASGRELLAIDDGQGNETFIISGSSNEATSQFLLTTESSNSVFMPYDDTSFKPAVHEVVASNDPSIQKVLPKGEERSDAFSCVPCSKSFATYKAKSQHERIVHSKDKLHTCGICNRAFANSHYLRDHLKIHSNVKPFKCDAKGCEKTFRLGKDLTRHNRVHSGEKPFKCQECGKSFSASSNLSEHRTLHTGKMAYDCTICKKKFRLWTTMRKHSLRCPAAKKSSSGTAARMLIGDQPHESMPEPHSGMFYHHPIVQGDQLATFNDTLVRGDTDSTIQFVISSSS